MPRTSDVIMNHTAHLLECLLGITDDCDVDCDGEVSSDDEREWNTTFSPRASLDELEMGGRTEVWFDDWKGEGAAAEWLELELRRR